MKVFGWILVAIGAVFAFLAFDLVNGNPDLNAPGQPLIFGGFQGAWRFLLGFLALIAALSIATGVIVICRMPGLSYLALIAFFILSVPYVLVGGLAPSIIFALVFLIVFVVVVPALVFLIAFAISSAVVKRRVPEVRVA